MDLATSHGSAEAGGFVERRAATRHRVFKGATLTYNRGFGALECTVRNMSEGGARLSFGETVGLPPAFDLAISGEERRAARVVWRSMIAAGIVFS